jgi:hypothetical protein
MIPQSMLAGRYELGPLLGRGGMGEVYRAWDGLLGREIALKVLRPEYAGSREFVARFEREAQNAAALSHPNVVRVFDAGGAPGGTRYIAMEYVSGGTLADRIRAGGALAPRVAVGVAHQIAGALFYAHRCGIVHRDVKPHNVLVAGGGEAKVADFGIARVAEATILTRPDMVVGSVGYLSPEQARGEPADHRTDLYSLGVVLYEMLTGRLPFQAESPIGVAMKHATQAPPSPRATNPAVPEDLAAVTLKLLSKDPDDRHANAGELMTDLERLRDKARPKGAPTAPTAVLPGAAAVRSRRRRRRVAALVAVVCGVAALALAPLAFGEEDDDAAPEMAVGRTLSPSAAAHPGAPEEAPDPPRSDPPAAAKQPVADKAPSQRQISRATATTVTPVSEQPSHPESLIQPQHSVLPRDDPEPESSERPADAPAEVEPVSAERIQRIAQGTVERAMPVKPARPGYTSAGTPVGTPAGTPADTPRDTPADVPAVGGSGVPGIGQAMKAATAAKGARTFGGKNLSRAGP